MRTFIAFDSAGEEMNRSDLPSLLHHLEEKVSGHGATEKVTTALAAALILVMNAAPGKLGSSGAKRRTLNPVSAAAKPDAFRYPRVNVLASATTVTVKSIPAICLITVLL